jgi:SAM-dependent methyltransferase
MRPRQVGDEVLEAAAGYQRSAVLVAAAELDLFSAVRRGHTTAAALARHIGADERATAVLADALAALGFLEKAGEAYRVPDALAPSLAGDGGDGALWMLRHQANCLRRWAELARVVKTGRPAERRASVRGQAGDLESFIRAMDDASRRFADEIVAAAGDIPFAHLLDIGGGPGTWTAAWLRRRPGARATLFDRPEVLPIARAGLAEAGFGGRVEFAAGDALNDPLPPGADLAWISAIIHQFSREENVRLFRRAREALVPGGRVVIRDVVMDASRTRPTAGALFAVNMLVGTEGGGTYTLEEIREDLVRAGFAGVERLREDERMNSLVVAERR